MVEMDLNGITWVGHVYQKFEAVCLEVEEIMYQDTVKYVEDQVQTVGASVKKFYSDVIQDFLPPSSTDVEKESAASDLSVKQHTNVGTHKRSESGLNEETVKDDIEHLTGDIKAPPSLDKDTGNRPRPFSGLRYAEALLQPSLGNTVRGAYADLYADRSNHRKPYNKNSLGVKRISKLENAPTNGTSKRITHLGKDLSTVSLSCAILDKNQEAYRNQMAMSPTVCTAEASDCNSIGENCDKFESKGASQVLTDSPPSINGDKIKVARIRSSSDGSSAELSAADTCTTNELVSPVGPSVIQDLQHNNDPDKVISLCHTACTDPVDNSNGLEQCMETIRKDDNQVEETCILVNGDELPSVPYTKLKQRPYKKKIQHAIYSKMRSARKQEYKQLAEWYGEAVKSNKQCIKTLMPPSHDNGESDWELL